MKEIPLQKFESTPRQDIYGKKSKFEVGICISYKNAVRGVFCLFFGWVWGFFRIKHSSMNFLRLSLCREMLMLLCRGSCWANSNQVWTASYKVCLEEAYAFLVPGFEK